MSLISAISSILRGNPKQQLSNDKRPKINARVSSRQSIRPTLVLLTYDEFFPENNALPLYRKAPGIGPAPVKLSPYSKVKHKIPQLDITRITNRIIVCGLPWDNSNDRLQHRINSLDLATFLNERYNDKYLLFNLAGTNYHHSTLRRNYCRKLQHRHIQKPSLRLQLLKGLPTLPQTHL
jgi:hypothetical protein